MTSAPPRARPSPLRGLRALAGRPETALFALAFGTYAYFFQAGGWNQNSRLDLVRAIVEQGGVAIDDYVGNTGDYSVFGRHFYCDKAPGTSMLAVPVYAVVYAVAHDERPRGPWIHLAGYVCTLWAVGLPSALAATVLFRIAARLGAPAPAAAALTLAWIYGTLALPYSTLLYGHQLAAALLVFAFAALLDARGPAPSGAPPSAARGRLLLAGGLLGCAVATEYPVALAAAALGLYAAAVIRPARSLAWFVLGGLPPILALAAYHAFAFGSPFTLPYVATQDVAREGGLFLGLTLPSPALLVKILFSPDRGLLVHAPWLALALPGGLTLVRRGRHRAEGLLCLAVMAAGLWFNASLTTTPGDWKGGTGIGTRHLVPSLPFYILATAGLVAGPAAWWRRPIRWIVAAAFAALVAFSAGRMVRATAVRPEVPKVDDPFADYIDPRWDRGALAENTSVMHNGPMDETEPQAWNLGQRLFGLQGRATLLPLGAFAIVVMGWLSATMRGRAVPEDRPPEES